ncbi:MAG: CBS domain-containing protein [Candidatus Helarchaeota archaeon]
MPKLSVKEVQSHDVYWLDPTATVLEAAKLMSDKNISSVTIEEEGRPIGIITERDIVQRIVALKKDPQKVTCKDIMTSPMLTIRPDAPLVDAMQKMIRGNVKRLVVIDDSFRSMGMISYSDILKVSPDLLEILSIEVCSDEFLADSFSGYCARCNEWTEHLHESEDGEFLCKSCLQL